MCSRVFYSSSSKRFIDTLKTSSLIHQCSSSIDNIENNVSGIYLGIDPTAPYLHVGHLPGILALIRAANEGVPAFAVLGGSTATIGDPSFNTNARALLSCTDVSANLFSIRRQLESIFFKLCSKTPPQILDNSEWLSGLGLVSFLKGFGRHIRVSELLSRDSVLSRLKAKSDGCTFQELSYSLLQGYDFYHLFQKYNVNLQIGGSDQWGNMIAGLDFISKMPKNNSGISKAYALTLPLITSSKGSKLSKSAGNAVWLSGPLSSAYDVFQFFIRSSDVQIRSWIGYFTLLTRQEIDDILDTQQKQPHLYTAHKEVARRVIGLVFGGVYIEILIVDDHYEHALKVSSAIFDETMHLDVNTLVDAFVKFPKRYFQLSARSDNRKIATYEDLLGIIADSKAESWEQIRYVAEKQSLMFNKHVITDTNAPVPWDHCSISSFGSRVALIFVGRSNPYLFNLLEK